MNISKGYSGKNGNGILSGEIRSLQAQIGTYLLVLLVVEVKEVQRKFIYP
jgi:hypothetical protein